MRRQEVLRKIQTHREDLRALSVRSLSVFGSVAREESSDVSDVDLLVEFDKPVGLFQFTRARRTLSEWLGCHVDLVTAPALREEMRETILREAVRVV